MSNVKLNTRFFEDKIDFSVYGKMPTRDTNKQVSLVRLSLSKRIETNLFMRPNEITT